MNYLIVDDEPLARQRLIQLLKSIDPNINTLEAGNGKKALDILNKETVTTVFLDIRMPIMDGLEAAKYINQLATPPVIIFTTAYNEFALDAFELNAIDYLLKPIAQQKLQATLKKAIQLNAIQVQYLQKESKRTHVSSKIGSKQQLIALKDIAYFYCEDKYIIAVSNQKNYIIEDKIKDLEQEFSSSFSRIHRNALVNKHMITGLNKKESKHYVILQEGKHHVEVSRRALSSVKALLKSR